MDVLQHKKSSIGANRSACDPYDIRLVFPAMQSCPLESNIYAIAELAQSVFKRENSCILRVIHDMLYPQ